MYSVADYGRMAADGVRMDAFKRAIAAVVKPEAVVLDLGAGTGIMSFLALRAGARRVHAVDPNPAVWLIPELARENGFGERIIVHQKSSLEMSVPERVDVVISDMRGPSPLVDQNLRALKDIRARWLRDGAVVLPHRDRLCVVLVEAMALSRRLDDAITSFERFGFSVEAVRRSVRNQVYSDWHAPLAASDMLSTSAVWTEIDYEAIDTNNLQGRVELEVVRGGMATGLCAFFETELLPGIGYTTEPGQAVIYNRLFMPLATPVGVEVGDRLRVTVRADVQGERYAWDTHCERGSETVAKYRQASFLGQPSSYETLLRGTDTSRPRLGTSGSLLRSILTAMDGTQDVRTIASAVHERTPEARAEVLELVRSLAIRYGE